MSQSINWRALATLTSGAALTVSAALATPRQADAATLYACIKKNGNARLFSRRPKCKRHESRLSWNTSGPAGRNGLNGSNGAPGKDGAAGRDGAAGKDGVNGKDGLNGIDGANGVDGANGAVGGFATALAAGEPSHTRPPPKARRRRSSARRSPLATSSSARRPNSSTPTPKPAALPRPSAS